MDTKSAKQYNAGHRKRLKQKFLSSGFDGWCDYESFRYDYLFRSKYWGFF